MAGSDVTVPFLERAADDGVLLPVEYVVDPSAKSRFNLYDYRLKSAEANKVQARCPPDLPRGRDLRLQAISKIATRTLGIRRRGAPRLPTRRGRAHSVRRRQQSPPRSY